jgi:hypothetical protein
MTEINDPQATVEEDLAIITAEDTRNAIVTLLRSAATHVEGAPVAFFQRGAHGVPALGAQVLVRLARPLSDITMGLAYAGSETADLAANAERRIDAGVNMLALDNLLAHVREDCAGRPEGHRHHAAAHPVDADGTPPSGSA